MLLAPLVVHGPRRGKGVVGAILLITPFVQPVFQLAVVGWLYWEKAIAVAGSITSIFEVVAIASVNNY